MEIDSEVVDKESNVIVEAMVMVRGQNTAIVADGQYKIRVINLETGECRYVLYSNCVIPTHATTIIHHRSFC